MGSGSARYGVAVLILVILWIAVYWWTPAPPQEPVVSFGDFAQSPRASLAQGNALTSVRTSPNQSAPSSAIDQNTVVPNLSAPAAQEDPVKPKPVPTPAQASPEVRTEPPPPEIIPPTFRDYTVRSGDTAESISRRFFGTPAHWQQIMKANPRVDFMRLKAGRVIRVPVDPANVQGIPGTSAPPKAAPAIEYRVKTGDTLSGIAKEIYGRSGLWTIIRDANRDQVGADGDRLRPGMVLKIPPAPAPATR